MAFRPRAGDTDAERNLISNIHARGVPPNEAAARIVNLAAQMMERQISGVGLKERML
jgi:ethanolamine ammonia-lyase small subunit